MGVTEEGEAEETRKESASRFKIYWQKAWAKVCWLYHVICVVLIAGCAYAYGSYNMFFLLGFSNYVSTTINKTSITNASAFYLLLAPHASVVCCVCLIRIYCR